MKGWAAFAGASSKGLGLPLAESRAAAGVNPAMRARGEEALGRAAQRIRGCFDVDVPGQALDVNDFEAVTKFINETRNRFASVNICVTNAGGARFGPLVGSFARRKPATSRGTSVPMDGGQVRGV